MAALASPPLLSSLPLSLPSLPFTLVPAPRPLSLLSTSTLPVSPGSQSFPLTRRSSPYPTGSPGHPLRWCCIPAGASGQVMVPPPPHLVAAPVLVPNPLSLPLTGVRSLGPPALPPIRPSALATVPLPPRRAVVPVLALSSRALLIGVLSIRGSTCRAPLFLHRLPMSLFAALLVLVAVLFPSTTVSFLFLPPFLAIESLVLVSPASSCPLHVHARARLVSVPAWCPCPPGVRARLVSVPAWCPCPPGVPALRCPHCGRLPRRGCSSFAAVAAFSFFRLSIRVFPDSASAVFLCSYIRSGFPFLPFSFLSFFTSLPVLFFLVSSPVVFWVIASSWSLFPWLGGPRSVRLLGGLCRLFVGSCVLPFFLFRGSAWVSFLLPGPVLFVLCQLY
jgi:hypothetical protein